MVKSKVPVQPKSASDDMKMRTAKEVPFYDLTIAYLRKKNTRARINLDRFIMGTEAHQFSLKDLYHENSRQAGILGVGRTEPTPRAGIFDRLLFLGRSSCSSLRSFVLRDLPRAL